MQQSAHIYARRAHLAVDKTTTCRIKLFCMISRFGFKFFSMVFYPQQHNMAIALLMLAVKAAGTNLASGGPAIA